MNVYAADRTTVWQSIPFASIKDSTGGIPVDVWNKALDIFSIVMLNTNYQPFFSAMAVLYLIGLWKIFEKCGVRGWWALVPIARAYKLALCSDRELEGRTLTVLEAVNTLLRIANVFFDSAADASIVYALITLLLMLVDIVYTARVYMGLCEVFNQRKRWVILWILAEAVPALIWGFDPKFQPLWTAEEIRDDAPVFFSGRKADVLEKGLTVNLEDRTVRDFFRKKYLLRDIHLDIEPGHMVLLLGGSGAGKTTFVNAVNGYEPARAEVMINGRNMYKNYKEMMYDIGFVPQQDLMRGSDSVFRTLMDAAALRLPSSFSRTEREERVEQVMEIFGLSPVRRELVSKLSGGQRKRLSIAMEFLSNPTLFILDEPDSGLDGVMARELFLQLRKIADQGKIIIVITHTPDRVIDLFDDVIVLAKDQNRTGRLAWFGPIPEARRFFGREKMEEIVKAVNRAEEGGDGLADTFIQKFAEVQHG